MSTHIAIKTLTDSTIDRYGFDARSAYVETFWLPTLGPTSLLLLRHLADRLEAEPTGVHLPVAETSRLLGLGEREGNQSPLRRSLARLVQFDLARHDGGAAYAVRRVVPTIHPRHVRRLPQSLQDALATWNMTAPQRPFEKLQQQTRRIAGLLAAAGASERDIERALAARGFHPSLCFAAARWACECFDEIATHNSDASDAVPSGFAA